MAAMETESLKRSADAAGGFAEERIIKKRSSTCRGGGGADGSGGGAGGGGSGEAGGGRGGGGESLVGKDDSRSGSPIACLMSAPYVFGSRVDSPMSDEGCASISETTDSDMACANTYTRAHKYGFYAWICLLAVGFWDLASGS
eukprot:gnl/TRDRNA2_/TRDRNA2_37688_c0_seq1.p1 gnl/TRDRNA2_/TRDRNA2_37688_c0~~gnl/TRDRNA2_/TRDRNA2_37688_c0_seq1.p1  ORF type:complete len:156 (+),score=31.76 gnl/TRDRNA2_/TRDRNA2_37688_c0_seq1:41-469(+)